MEDYERCQQLRARVAAALPQDMTALTQLANIQIARGEVLWKQSKFDEAAALTGAQEQLQTPALSANHAETAKRRQSVAAVLQDLQAARAKAYHGKVL